MSFDRKAFKSLRHALLQEGWRIRRGKGHERAFCPCGEHIVVLTLSASDTRNYKNTLSLVRHCPRCPASLKSGKETRG